MRTGIILAALVAVLVLPLMAMGHPGRRFEIGVSDGQLVAQGLVTTGVDDGGGIVRPYTNVIHDHWANTPLNGVELASASLPGFDVPVSTASQLQSHSLGWTLRSLSKWSNPPSMTPAGTVPDLVPLDPGEQLEVFWNGDPLSEDPLSPSLLSASVPASGLTDLDPVYSINSRPAGVLHVVEFVLSTSAPGVADSDPVFVVLAPDGMGPVERLHHASLFLEQRLALQATPEPSTAVLLATVLGLVSSRRARRSVRAVPQPASADGGAPTITV